ncbi:type IV pilus secretin PilQ [Vulcaniibacterium gelatinicum]|uniref:type IV pilus secretin PilQ n=1 Tax=Vulcaniibacterium gelatinicum TaxID=2598725 RepID=UPI0011C82818|nr:type IV pilus secretin PilQ family protein [Vulcaniibacterium gelatinicum]
MTVNNANNQRPARRPKPMHAGALGIAIGLLATLGSAGAASPGGFIAQAGTVATPADPAKEVPGAITVSNVDFKRGDGGAGRLSLRFSGTGAAPDLRTEGSRVIVDLGAVKLPASLQKALNVTDFATPVQRIDPMVGSGGTRLVLSTKGAFESLAYQTGNEYVVEIVPRATTPAKAVGASIAVMGQAGGAEAVRAYSGRPVTFNFQDVPVRTVLQLIAEESGLNIVASDTVSGNVTLRLVNVPWDQALDIILRAKGLDKRRDGNVVWVAPQEELARYEQSKEDARIAIENRAEMVTEYIPVSYGNAEEIAKLLTDESKTGQGGGGAGGVVAQSRGFLSPRGSISFDRRTNTMLVIDIPSRVAEIKRLVSLLDKPVDQVLIEARIVIASESFARELGAKFGISGNKDNTYYSGNLDANTENRNSDADTDIANANLIREWLIARQTDPTLPPPILQNSTITRGLNVNLPVVNAAGSLALSILNAGYLLDIELSALQEEGRGEVISNPRIVTSNQKEAVIRQGQEVGYVTIAPQQGGTAIPIPNVQFKDVLLELKVTPTITHDGRVFLNMAVKKDEIQGFVNTSIGDVPQINKREVNTAVLIQDGQTVVIGGVYEFRDRSDVTKVPFLGDLPILGNLFKKKGRSKEKAELLIFITPKVMRVAQRD